MKFVCDRCQTKYSIADEKVRGKVLKVRCKTCQNVITVREPGARPSVGALAPVRASQRPSSSNLAPVGGVGIEEELEKSERTMLTSAPAALMADLAQPRRATPPPPPPVGDGIEWFLAIEGAQQGPFSRKLLVDKLFALPKDADVHVWNDRMDGWKSPGDVPDVARELAARRTPALPTRPPVPRTTPSPPVPPLAARRGTQPLVSGVGLGAKLPGPLAASSHAHAHAVPAPHGHAASEPHVAHKTPAPVAKPANGVAAHGAPASSPTNAFLGGESDAMSALNLGGAATRSSPAVAPRIMEVGEATAWAGQGRVSEGRHSSTKMLIALMVVVGVSVVMITINFTKKSTAVTMAPPTKTALDSESLGKLAEQAARDNAVKPAPSGNPAPGEAAGAAEPQRTRGPHGRPLRGGRPIAGHGPTSPGPMTGPAPATPPGAAPTPGTPPVGGFADHERKVGPAPSVANRPAPSQGEISRVIANNKIGIKTCYQRALLRDSSLTHGKIVVGVTIGISGRVKHVTVDGPSSFRALEPCIKEMLARWVFPQSYEEYGTEFSYLFQGNE